MSEDRSDEEPQEQPPKGKVPRATKAQLEAVRKTAEEVVTILDKEQEESITSLAQALDEISEGEALAHIDTRLSFMERQVERIMARRDEADRGFQAELNVMRARVEDALSAVGTTADEHRAAIGALEERLASQITGQDSGARELSESVRAELASMVNAAVSKLEMAEARIRGEMKAIQDLAEERTRGVVAAVEEGKHLAAEAELKIDASIRSAEEKVAEIAGRIDAEVARIDSSFEGRIEQEREQVDQRLDMHASELMMKLNTEIAKMVDLVGSESREADARLGETSADLRLEIHQLRTALEESAQKSATLVELARNDAIGRVESSEQKAAGAAIHLESMINQVRKQMKSFEEEWAGALAQVTHELNGVKVRAEEVAAKFDSVDSRRTSDRAAIESSVRGLATKVDMVETRLGQVVEEVMAKQATRMEVLASQVANMTQSEVAQEERSGAVDFLAKRLAEVTERLDELSAKYNAAVRSAGTPGRPSVQPVPAQAPDELVQRLAVLESRMMALSSKPRQDAVTHGLASRIDSLERALAEVRSMTGSGSDHSAAEAVVELRTRLEQMVAKVRSDSSAGDVMARLEALERTLAGMPTAFSARQADILARLDELDRRIPAQSTTILPEKKRRGLL